MQFPGIVLAIRKSIYFIAPDANHVIAFIGTVQRHPRRGGGLNVAEAGPVFIAPFRHSALPLVTEPSGNHIFTVSAK